ncbi:MAG TPA: hypothetical protein VHI52_12275, partial [Verrucomicrobiae bacterium]|nr:hypothetical protein [Verrucomicrobiae bacterium]
MCIRFPLRNTAKWIPLLVASLTGLNSRASSYTRLTPLPAPKIIASSEAYPGGRYDPSNLLDGDPATEYSSNAKGTNTFVEFDFGKPTAVI